MTLGEERLYDFNPGLHNHNKQVKALAFSASALFITIEIFFKSYRSMIMAIPMPPPIHMEIMPVL